MKKWIVALVLLSIFRIILVNINIDENSYLENSYLDNPYLENSYLDNPYSDKTYNINEYNNGYYNKRYTYNEDAYIDGGYIDVSDFLINNKMEELSNIALKILIDKHRKNPDCIGVIFIPETNFTYIVMQSDIPNFYLNRGFGGEYSLYGLPYIGEGFNLSENILIYGHCINYDEAFGKLLKYKSDAYLREHPYVCFVFKHSGRIYKGFYKICQVMSINVYYDNFRYWEMFSDFESDVIKPEDKVLMLSTCDNERGGGYRLVLVAKRTCIK